MYIGGSYVGLGEGDLSDEVARAKAHFKRKFTPARNTLDDGPLFTPALTAEVKRIQAVYTAEKKPGAPKYIPGVINLEFKYDVGILQRPEKPRPIIFTIEGHMSTPWAGPCAYVASTLEQQGVCWWQPVDYDTRRLPFNNKSGRLAYLNLLGQTVLKDGNGVANRPFPLGHPHGLISFSQGAIVANQVFLDHLRPAAPGTPLAARRDSLTRSIALGDPYREKDADAGWWSDPPRKGTQGISDRRMTDTPHWWKSANRTGDLYTENPDDETGLNRTAIYKIVSENSWAGGPAGLLQRVMDFATPADDVLPIAKAILGGVMFLGNMQTHGGYDLNPCIEYMRGVATRPERSLK